MPLLSHFGRGFHRPGSEALSYPETQSNSDGEPVTHGQPYSANVAHPDSNGDRYSATLGNAKPGTIPHTDRVANAYRDPEIVSHAISYSHRRSQPISHGNGRQFTLPFGD